MRKTTRIVLALMLLVTVLSSCVRENPAENTTKENSSASTEDREESYFRQTAEGFLTALKSGDNEKLADLLYINDPALYTYFENLDIGSYNIVEQTRSNSDIVRFTVEMDIERSGSSVFPEGRSVWNIDVSDLYASIVLFRPSDKAVSRIFFEKQPEDVLFCSRFSTHFGCFETVDDLNQLVPDTENTALYNRFCYDLIGFLNTQLTFEGDTVREEQVLALAEKTLGITTLDLGRYEKYNKESGTITHSGGGLPGYFGALSSREYNPITKQSVMTIDFYADSGFLLVGKTMQYVVRENDDKSYSLLSVNLKYDSGYGLSMFG